MARRDPQTVDFIRILSVGMISGGLLALFSGDHAVAAVMLGIGAAIELVRALASRRK